MRSPILPDPQRVIACLIETSEQDILPRFCALGADDVMEKGPDDPVTVADIASEKRLTRLLMDLVPGSVVVAEEAVANDMSLLGLLHEDAPVWLIDPIGGTKTFVQGDPGFGIYVSLMHKGAVLAGWVHDPVAGDTSYAAVGEGAWDGDRRLSVAASGEISGMRCYVHPRVYTYDEADAVRARQDEFAAIVPIGSVGAAFRALSSGQVHVGVFAGMWQWDHAPGVLIHREAGGYAARRDGVVYDPTERFRSMLATPDEDCWQRIHEFLKPD
jgi:fructose-1,6-bisphosphatase/inositol monophosphatase family enzyme